MAELTPKTIAELPEATALLESGLIALSQESNSRKATIATMRKAMQNAALVSDANISSAEETRIVWYRTNSSTLHTPYTEGITGFTYGYIIAFSISANTCFQLCLVSGSTSMYTRRLYNGSWTPWRAVLTSDRASTVRYSTVNCSVTPNGVSTTSVTFPNGTFSSAPSVTATLADNFSGAALMSAIAISVRNVTATGFDIQLGVNADTTVQNIAVRWQAIGYAE